MTHRPNLPTESAEELYEDAPCGYMSTLPGGLIARVNATFLNWTGYERSELVLEKSVQQLLAVGGRVFYETHLAPLLHMQGYVNEIAFDLVCKDGTQLPVLINAVQRRDDRGDPMFNRITVFNATDRRRYEQDLLEARKAAEDVAQKLQVLNATLEQRVASEVAERLRAEEALRQAQKMEAIGQLTGGVAHDFNNLLTIVVGNLDMLLRHLPPDSPRLRRAAERAMQGARRAVALTQRLLSFSRQQPLEPRLIDLNQLVLGMSDLLRQTLGHAVVLDTLLDGKLWRTRADPNQLENALLNLAANARDAMQGQGRLTIRTANAELDAAATSLLAEPVPAGQYVAISVSDTGSGMDGETMRRVFEPFFTTKEVGKGTGLGLSQVYGFVRQSGGHVRIESELGKGTTVSIQLPRDAAEQVEQHAGVRRLPGCGRGSGETVLVVEDEPELRSYAADALTELGYRVVAAADGPSALRVLDDEPAVALLFTDVVLPGGMNGRQLAEEITRLRPGVRVLFTTGYTRDAVVDRARLEHGVHLIAKPFSYDDLAATIRHVLDGR